MSPLSSLLQTLKQAILETDPHSSPCCLTAIHHPSIVPSTPTPSPTTSALFLLFPILIPIIFPARTGPSPQPTLLHILIKANAAENDPLTHSIPFQRHEIMAKGQPADPER